MVKPVAQPEADPAVAVRVALLDIGRLDRTIARRVRADRADAAERARLEEWADELADLYREEKSLPPVRVYTWAAGGGDPPQLLLSDGESRTRGREKAGLATVEAEVHTYPTRAGAERAAREFAYRANAKHGLKRNTADRRATVQEALLDPAHAIDSDNEIRDLCGVSRGLVKQLRLELSFNGVIPRDSPAHADNRTYTKGGGPRPGYAYAEDGSTVRTCPRRKGCEIATPGGPVEGCVGVDPPPDGCDNRDRCEYEAGSPLPRPDPRPAPTRPSLPRPPVAVAADAPDLPTAEDTAAHWWRRSAEAFAAFKAAFGHFLNTAAGMTAVTAAAADLGITVVELATESDRFTGRATQTGVVCGPESELARLLDEAGRLLVRAALPAA